MIHLNESYPIPFLTKSKTGALMAPTSGPNFRLRKNGVLVVGSPDVVISNTGTGTYLATFTTNPANWAIDDKFSIVIEATVDGVVVEDVLIGGAIRGDAYARLGAPVGASVSADVAAVQADTTNLKTRVPAALVSGRMDASAGAIAANAITATAIATNAITSAKIATDAITSAQLATTAVDEIKTGLATQTSVDTIGANVTTANTALTAIKTVTDKFLFDASNFVRSAAQSLVDYVTPLDATATQNAAQAGATAALNTYDPPTRNEATTDKDAVIAAIPTDYQQRNVAVTLPTVDGIPLTTSLEQVLAMASGENDPTDNGDGTYTLTFLKRDDATTSFSVIYNPTTGARTRV